LFDPGNLENVECRLWSFTWFKSLLETELTL